VVLAANHGISGGYIAANNCTNHGHVGQGTSFSSSNQDKQRNQPLQRDPLEEITPNDPTKVMIIFDCNGTVTSLSAVRNKRGSSRVRPGVEALEKLKGRFSLALWTSAMQQNLAKMQIKVEQTANLTFDRTLHRGHCVSASPEVLLKRKHETCKPLHKFFGEVPGPGLGRVILVDDNPDKSLPDETTNMLLLLAWVEGAPVDRVVEVLVEGLLAMDDTQLDIRAQIAIVQQQVWNYWNALEKKPSTSSPESSPSESFLNEERRQQKRLLKKEQGRKKKSKDDRKRAKLDQQKGDENTADKNGANSGANNGVNIDTNWAVRPTGRKVTL
jgi:hypothetical protein